MAKGTHIRVYVQGTTAFNTSAILVRYLIGLNHQGIHSRNNKRSETELEVRVDPCRLCGEHRIPRPDFERRAWAATTLRNQTRYQLDPCRLYKIYGVKKRDLEPLLQEATAPMRLTQGLPLLTDRSHAVLMLRQADRRQSAVSRRILVTRKTTTITINQTVAEVSGRALHLHKRRHGAHTKSISRLEEHTINMEICSSREAKLATSQTRGPVPWPVTTTRKRYLIGQPRQRRSGSRIMVTLLHLQVKPPCDSGVQACEVPLKPFVDFKLVNDVCMKT